MPTRTSKKMYYMRAVQDQLPMDLETVIRAARQAKPSVSDSEITFESGEIIRIQRQVDPQAGGVFLQLTKYVPGEGAPTVSSNSLEIQDNESTQTAPAGREFKDGDCYLFVSNFHVLFCSHGILLPRAINYLSKLFRACGFGANVATFNISAVANQDRLRLLREHGVRSIKLSTNAFDINLPRAHRRSYMAKVFGKFSDELGALIEQDDNIADQRAREDLIVDVEVRLNGNTKAAQDAKEVMEDLAEGVFDDPDGPVSQFVILTQGDEKITPDSVRLQKAYTLVVSDRSLSSSAVLNSMSDYFNILQQDNLLEQ